jgi:predicted MFS family arabinose efflux permease
LVTQVFGSERQVRRRFLLLRGLRWFPTGLLIPVLVLILLDRGFSLTQIGLIASVQGLVVLLLELPTGALADAVGRRPVLLVANLFLLASVALLAVADSLILLALSFALQGAYRALESGPLDAWYVDAAQAADTDADIGRGFAQGGVVLGVAIAVGSLLSSGLVLLGPVGPVDPLVLPVLAALIVQFASIAAIYRLMIEPHRDFTARAWGGSVRQAPAVVQNAARMIRTSHVLLALLGVELLWGFGMTAFETFTPVKLADVTGNADTAAALLGPTTTAAWLVSAAGAAVVPLLSRRFGTVQAAAALRVAQGLAVGALALVTGPLGVIAAFLVTMTIHGASNPAHLELLHRAVEGPGQRVTVASANGMVAQGGGALGGIALGALADTANLTAAILVGAAVLAAAAPLYLVSGRTSAVQRA